MDKDTVYLSKLLRGENMGINIYKQYLNKLPNGTYKKEVDNFLDEHKRHKNRLENMMISRGEYPKAGTGIQGKMSEGYTAAKLIIKGKPKDIMDDIYKGELMALTSTQKYLTEFSESIRPDIEKLIDENKKRLEKVHNMIATMEK